MLRSGKRRASDVIVACVPPGKIPAILYGHGKENISLSISADEFAAAIRHGSRLLKLTGDITDTALIKECQWNTWGTEVLHIDFTRTSLDEKVNAQIAIELRGEAPGAKEGGTVNLLLHELEVECTASSIPEKFEISINDLELNGHICVSDLELAKNVTVLADPETVIVSCIPVVEEEEEAEEGAEAEPEIIGRKKEDEEE